MTLKIGDTSRNGLYQIVDTNWDHNGSLRVEVRMVGRILHTEKDERAMRRLARRAIHHPEKTQSSRMIGKFIVGDDLHMRFAVSRLPR